MKFKGCKAAASKASKAKTEAGFGMTGPDYTQVSILKALGAISICKAMVSTASKAITEARFGLSGPDYPQVSILEAIAAI